MRHGDFDNRLVADDNYRLRLSFNGAKHYPYPTFRFCVHGDIVGGRGDRDGEDCR